MESQELREERVLWYIPESCGIDRINSYRSAHGCSDCPGHQDRKEKSELPSSGDLLEETPPSKREKCKDTGLQGVFNTWEASKRA